MSSLPAQKTSNPNKYKLAFPVDLYLALIFMTPTSTASTVTCRKSIFL